MSEQIESREIVPTGSVDVEEKPSDTWRILGALIIAGCAIFLGAMFASIALWVDNSELLTWATGLISLVVGAAIGFLFGGK